MDPKVMEEIMQPQKASDIHTKLNRCIQQRQAHYQHISALSVRFEADDTGAAQDLPHFKRFTRTLGIDVVDECVLLADDRTPSYTLAARIRENIRRSAEGGLLEGLERYLIIIHYAGHGAHNPDKGLWFAASEHLSRRSFNFTALADYVSANAGQVDVPVDAVFIIDSCGAGSASCFKPEDSTYELLAAVPQEDMAFSAASGVNQRHTFIAKLADAAVIAQGKAQSIDFAELLQSAYCLSSAKFPTHKLLSGSTSIRVRFQTHSHPTLQPHRSLPLSMTISTRVLFSLHFLEDPSSEATQRLRSWIEAFGSDIGLKIEAVYQAQSTVIIVLAPYSVFFTMRDLPGTALIASEVTIPQNPAPVMSVSVHMSAPQ